MKSKAKFNLELSYEAYDDLIDIQAYTYSEFGEAQWKKYEGLLNGAFEHLIQSPYSGHRRKDVSEAYLSWNVGEHVMVYRVEEDTIYVVRVLHSRMNFLYKL